MEQPDQFVGDWNLVCELGEGAFSTVSLLIHTRTQEKVACKRIEVYTDQAARNANKEYMLLCHLQNHPNVIQCFGRRIENEVCFIFLEYADCGELFDRIEPDVGMPVEMAHNYFCQLISGVQYLHSKGIAHRDIKPENLLLNNMNVLKITDFGFATVFRNKGRECRFNSRCGTLPYAAPEVLALERDYSAEPVDIWSCGVVLITMLSGQLPWESATIEDTSFEEWKELRIKWQAAPWANIGHVALSLLRNMLQCNPDRRATIPKIKEHRWYSKDYSGQRAHLTRVNSGGGPATKRLKLDLGADNCASQPTPTVSVPDENTSLAANAGPDCDEFPDRFTPPPNMNVSFSQPTNLDALLLHSQVQSQTQSQTLNPLQMLVRRMTRFFVTTAALEALDAISDACVDCGCNVRKIENALQLSVSTEGRRVPTVFKVNVYEMPDKKLVDFRLSKGDGLEFKRLFVKVKKRLAGLICRDNVLWLQQHGLLSSCNLTFNQLSLAPQGEIHA